MCLDEVCVALRFQLFHDFHLVFLLEIIGSGHGFSDLQGIQIKLVKVELHKIPCLQRTELATDLFIITFDSCQGL